MPVYDTTARLNTGRTQQQTNAFAPPPNPWATQPQPGGTGTTAANAFQLPQGFNIGQGSQDPAINRQVYGSNYFPGNLLNYPGITTPEQFWAQSPERQAGYRQDLARQNQLNQYLGQQPGYGDRFSYSNVQDFTQNPAYQSRLQESERALNRQLLATGRSDSTGGLNAFATNARRLGSEFEQEAYNRAYGENQTNYARNFQENESMYGREFAIRQFLDAMNINRDDANWRRAYDLMMAGAQPSPQ